MKEELFNTLRRLNSNSGKIKTQRGLAAELGFSLGKLNYCLKELKKKGLVKIKNFKNNKNKLNYIYILTPKGIAHKTNLTFIFMKRKMQEYEDLKKELEDNRKNKEWVVNNL